jgi:aspartate kinase
MVVLKFGGTSVGESDARRRVLEIVEAEARPRVLVVSALSGVTDALLKIASAGATPESLRALDALLDRHLDAARMLDPGPARTRLEEDLRHIGAQVSIVLRTCAGGATLRSCDEIVAAGELWSSRLLAALLRERGTPAEWIDARQVVRTNSEHGAAAPDLEATRAAVDRLVAPVVAGGSVPVVGGFLGSDSQGTTTTLGRGGSDYSAALLGACLDAEEIQIWTDVDGVLTADPRILPHARLVPHLSYGEAHDLAFFGAKVLHPGTITPAVQRNIPVTVRNSHRPAGAGTLVTGRECIDRTRSVVAGLACRAGVTLVEATACKGSEAGAGTSGLFEALRRSRVGEVVLAERYGDRLVLTIQSPQGSTAQADEFLDVELREALAEAADVRVRTALAMVVVVGEEVTSVSDLVAEATAALHEVPVYLTGRPAGGRTLAFVVDAANVERALRRLHDCFFGLARAHRSVSSDVVQA